MIKPIVTMAGMSSEVFRLHFNHFGPTVSNQWQSLRHEKDFCDVTLACEDNQVQAHKLVLSTCSPVFKQMLSQNQHQHPLLYFRGVKGSELVHLLDFIYQGEAHIDKEDLNSFLAMAEDLQVKGLTQNSEAKKIPPPPPIQPVVGLLEEEFIEEEPVIMPSRPGRKRKSSAKENSPKREKKEVKEPAEKKRRGGRKPKNQKEVAPEPAPEPEPEHEPEQLMIKHEPVDVQQIVDTSTISEEEQYNNYDSFSKDTSDPGFENIENLSMAEFLAKREQEIHTPQVLMGHLTPGLGHLDPERDQNGSIYSCEECDYQSPRKYNLSKHVESVHEGVRHPCVHCDYKATNRSNLKTHVRKKHMTGPIHGET